MLNILFFVLLSVAILLAAIPIIAAFSIRPFLRAILGLRKTRRLHIELRKEYIEKFSYRPDARTFLFRIKHRIETGGEDSLGGIPVGTRIALEHGQFAQAGGSFIKSMLFRSLAKKAQNFVGSKIQDIRDRKATGEDKSTDQLEREEAIESAVAKYLQMKADLWHGVRMLSASCVLFGLGFIVYLNR